jgi:uncharacterized membrane protein YfhO
VLRANVAFLAVRLSPGAHVVTLKYRPQGAIVGMVITLASAAACVFLVRARS